MRNSFYISTIAGDAGDVAREFGLGLEIAEFCTAANMDEHLAESTDRLAPVLRNVTLRTFHGPFNELFPCAIDPKARALAAERFLQAAELAKEYGAQKLILHGGFNPYIYFPVWYQQESIRFWQELMPCLPEEITVCLENVMEPEPEMLADIIRKTGHPRLKLCLDIGHANAYSRVPWQRWLKECSAEIAHFHIHNNDGSRDSHSGLAYGSIPMADFLQEALAQCPQATFTLELLQSRSGAEFLRDHGFLD